VTIDRGDWRKPAAGFSFRVNQPVTVYLAVDRRGEPTIESEWKRTNLSLTWGTKHRHDIIYSRKFSAGEIVIPTNATEHTPNAFGMPHAAFVQAEKTDELRIVSNKHVTVTTPTLPLANSVGTAVTFNLQVDKQGDGTWSDLGSVEVADGGYVTHFLPSELDAVWLRFQTDKDCIATAFLHQTSATHQDGQSAKSKQLFEGLADIDDSNVQGAVIYPAKRNRNLRVITDDDRYFEFTKSTFRFRNDKPDDSLKKLLRIEPEFTVDDASVILKSEGRTMRLPKGHAAYDKPFASGWPRGSREVESERHLANIHGTFYEVPLITNGRPPAFHLMRPVASHRKQITDFCTWNGLLVLAGIRCGVSAGDHIFNDPGEDIGLWFGGIDDLWQLGKPVGTGGPWKETAVRAGQASDPYLIYGYDKKSFRLMHRGETTVTVTAEIDITGDGNWVSYRTFEVSPKKETRHTFPAALSANWIRLRSDTDATFTATFRYE
jgi:hypothetical protein